MGGPQAELTLLGRRIKDALDGHRGAAEDIGIARSGFMEGLAERSRQRWWAPTRAKLLAAALGLVGAMAYWLVSPRRPITFKVGVENEPGKLYRAMSDPLDAVQLPFSDGSWALLEPGARMRVLGTSADGALLLLESGAAVVDVRGVWRMEAGPYTIDARDARFKARWSPARESLTLDTQEGVVEVSGGCVMAPRQLPAGQEIALSCRTLDQDLADVLDESAGDGSPLLDPLGEPQL